MPPQIPAANQQPPEIPEGTIAASSSTSVPAAIFPETPQPAAGKNSFAEFNSSTLAIDFAWQPSRNASGSADGMTYRISEMKASGSPIVAETSSTNFSYPVSDFGREYDFYLQAFDNAGASSTPAPAAVFIPDWSYSFGNDDGENSIPSHYSDNWYDLGTGFWGTLRSMTFEGYVNDANYFNSHLRLGEFLDPGYAARNKDFVISEDAPFAAWKSKITISGLNIPLQPNKYYRLYTGQDYQNRSVILAGTAATGTAMWNEFVYGTGRVEHVYAFSPYISAVMIPKQPLLPPTSPADLSVSFDSLGSRVYLKWSGSTDPDTVNDLITYEVNNSTSSLDESGWQPAGGKLSADFAVALGNSYVFAVRAVDDLGDRSAPMIANWSFPPDYSLLPSQLKHDSQFRMAGTEKIFLPASSTISAVSFWVAPNGGAYCCSQSYAMLFADNGGSAGDLIAASVPTTIGQYDGDREAWYYFPSPLALPAGAYWIGAWEGPSRTTNGMMIFGSADDEYAAGFSSEDASRDLYFRLRSP